MRKLNVTIRIAIHLALWLILFFLNFLFLKNYSVRFNYYVHIATWLIYVLIFYTTSYFLMPYFFRKKIIFFIAFSSVLLASTFIVKDLTNKKQFEYVMSRTFSEGERPPFKRPGPPPGFKKGRKAAIHRGRMIMNSYGLFLFYLLGFSFRLIQKWQDDEKQKIELEKEKVSTELSFLKQQINPHFLFNSLNSIYSLSISKAETTPDSILKLSSILRYVLYDSENLLVNLKDELKTIKDYIELQQLRLTDKVSVWYDVKGSPENYKIEPLLLIPLIENAFKYGIDNVNESFIDIQIEIEKENLKMKVSNKVVAKNNNTNNESGIGLKNIKRRLELLHANDYQFDINEENDVFSVTLQINLKT